NNLAGEDTVPPARLAPRDVVASGTDPTTNAITITTSRIPGDDLYCGTAAKFDFRFSTAGPITTQTQFDGATPVASVPAPPRGNHDAGTSLTVSDGRFAGQVVFLAAQVVDHAGNLSPVTSLGRFDVVPTTTTTLFACGSRPESGCQPAAPQKAHLVLGKGAVATSDFGNPTTTTDDLPCPLRRVGPATQFKAGPTSATAISGRRVTARVEF